MSQFRNLMMTKIGGEPSPLPEGYTECQFIESSGHQYINIASVQYGDHIHDIEFIGSDRMLIGSGASRALFWGAASGHNNYELGNQRIQLDCNSRRIVSYKTYDDKLVSLTIDGITVNENAVYEPGLLYALFRIYNYASAFCSAKLYNFKYYTLSNELQINLVPALAPNGRPCLFNTIGQQPFYNQGSGEFGYMTKNGVYVAPV